MAKHGSEKRHTYVDVDAVAPAIAAVFDERLEPPIVIRYQIYDLVRNHLRPQSPASGATEDAIDDLVEFDAWGRTEIERERRMPTGVGQTTTYDVVYYEPEVT